MTSRPRVPERLVWAAAQIDLKPKSTLLEIGCGSGQLLELLAAQSPSARLTGIDRSRSKVESAQSRFESARGTRRVHVHHQTLVEAATHVEHPYEVVVAVNVNTFWVDPTKALPALRRLVAPRGCVYLIFEPPSTAALRRIQAKLSHLLTEHGFRAPTVRTKKFSRTHGVCLETVQHRRPRLAR